MAEVCQQNPTPNNTPNIRTTGMVKMDMFDEWRSAAIERTISDQRATWMTRGSGPTEENWFQQLVANVSRSPRTSEVRLHR